MKSLCFDDTYYTKVDIKYGGYYGKIVKYTLSDGDTFRAYVPDSVTNDTPVLYYSYLLGQPYEKTKKYLEKINNLSSEDSSYYSPIGDINSEINNYKSSISNISESKIS